MTYVDFTDGVTALSVSLDPQGRRAYIAMTRGEALDSPVLVLGLNPEDAHDVIMVLQHMAQRHVPDDSEDGIG